MTDSLSVLTGWSLVNELADKSRLAKLDRCSPGPWATKLRSTRPGKGDSAAIRLMLDHGHVTSHTPPGRRVAAVTRHHDRRSLHIKVTLPTHTIAFIDHARINTKTGSRSTRTAYAYDGAGGVGAAHSTNTVRVISPQPESPTTQLEPSRSWAHTRLYRRLLRAHRQLPIDMRFMGDSYIKSEFRLTRKTDNPLHIIAFLSQWKVYLDELEQSSQNGTEAWRGKRLDAAKLDTMSKEQVGQLYELMHATKDVWKSYVRAN